MTDKEKVFAIPLLDKGLVSDYTQNSRNLVRRPTTQLQRLPIFKWAEDLKGHSMKEHNELPVSTLKDCSTFSSMK